MNRTAEQGLFRVREDKEPAGSGRVLNEDAGFSPGRCAKSCLNVRSVENNGTKKRERIFILSR